jgi:hypothetical protein
VSALPLQHRHRTLRAHAFAAALALGLWPGFGIAHACPEIEGPAITTLAALERHGDARGRDGALFRLTGVLWSHMPPPDLVANISSGWRDAAVHLIAAQPGRDRWGRTAATVSDARGQSLALAMVASGAALADPVPLSPHCRRVFLETEAQARAAKRGLWADGVGVWLAPAALGPAAARAGEVAVMEGTLRGVGVTRRAAFLNFGPAGTSVSAELPLSVWRTLERRGWTRERLAGQKVRVRGVVEAGRTPRLLIRHEAAIEGLE